MGKKRNPLVRATGVNALVRYALLALVVAGSGWAFNARFERRMADLRMTGAIADETDSITRDGRERLKELFALYQRDFAIRPQLRISRRDIQPRDLGNQTLFLGLSPAEGGEEAEVVIVLPPLARKALPDTVLEEEKRHLLVCMERGDVGLCAEQTLSALYAHLRN